jgi:FMN reductase
MDRSPIEPVAPLIVGIGGTQRAGSSSEKVIRRALEFAATLGARTKLLCGDDLVMPIYSPEVDERTTQSARLVDAVRRADGVVISSPGYHGSLSGLIKNALDYIEDLRSDARPYLQDRAVGCIAIGAGWQATGTTLATLRSIVHALRGWPTPLGVCVNSTCLAAESEAAVDGQVRQMVGQLVDFAHMSAALKSRQGCGRT